MDTEGIRQKMLSLWTSFDAGKISATQARVHIGFARSILDTFKVEVAVAHLRRDGVKLIPFDNKKAA